jgi:hypothetical protein
MTEVRENLGSLNFVQFQFVEFRIGKVLSSVSGRLPSTQKASQLHGKAKS